MRKWPDMIGIGLSGLCLAHCLLLPVALALLPALAVTGMADERAHLVLLGCALPVSAFAFWRGLRRHGFYRAGLLGGAGLLLMTAGVMLPVTEAGETLLTVIGVTALASGHMANSRLMHGRMARPAHASGGNPRNSQAPRS